MPIDIVVPPLSQTLDTLVIVEWLKQVGDPVVKGEALLTVETDKATLEVESPASGILSSVSAGSGEEVKIKSVIGSIAEAGRVTNDRVQRFGDAALAVGDLQNRFAGDLVDGGALESPPLEELERQAHGSKP